MPKHCFHCALLALFKRRLNSVGFNNKLRFHLFHLDKLQKKDIA